MASLNAVLAALVTEVLATVRAAMEDWSLTARLCVIIVVVTATTCTATLLLR